MVALNLSNETAGEIELCLAVIFFGLSFVLQRSAMVEGMPPLTYNAARYAVATMAMVLYQGLELLWCKYNCSRCITNSYHLIERSEATFHQKKNTSTSNSLEMTDAADVSDDGSTAVTDDTDADAHAATSWGNIWLWGGVLGLTSVGGSVLEQLGLVTVRAGKTAFITGLFVIVTPFAESIIPGFNVSVSRKSWIAAGVSVMGLVLLSGCVGAQVCIGGAVGPGELMIFFAMFMWVASILATDKACKVCNVLWLSTVEFVITLVITSLLAVYFEPEAWKYPFTDVYNSRMNIIAVGIVEAIAITLCNLGQEYTSPTRASLLYSMEGVAAAIFGYFYLNETLSSLEMIGCSLILMATLLSSIDQEEEDSDLLMVPRQATRAASMSLLVPPPLPSSSRHGSFSSIGGGGSGRSSRAGSRANSLSLNYSRSARSRTGSRTGSKAGGSRAGSVATVEGRSRRGTDADDDALSPMYFNRAAATADGSEEGYVYAKHTTFGSTMEILPPLKEIV